MLPKKIFATTRKTDFLSFLQKKVSNCLSGWREEGGAERESREMAEMRVLCGDPPSARQCERDGSAEIATTVGTRQRAQQHGVVIMFSEHICNLLIY